MHVHRHEKRPIAKQCCPRLFEISVGISSSLHLRWSLSIVVFNTELLILCAAIICDFHVQKMRRVHFFFPLLEFFQMWLNLIKRELGSVQTDSLLIHKETLFLWSLLIRATVINTSQQKSFLALPSTFNTTRWWGWQSCVRDHLINKHWRWKSKSGSGEQDRS